MEIQDAEQKPVYQKTLTASANGTIHDDLELPASAALGSYSIQVQAGDENFMNGNFEVEEYKKPEYEVRVTPAKARILQGETAQAIIDARYYFGEPVSRRQGEVRRLSQPLLVPAVVRAGRGLADADTGDADGNDYGDDQIVDSEGQLDADGKLTIDFPHHGLRPQDGLPLSHRSARHRRRQARDHRPRQRDRHLRQLRGERAARPLFLSARRQPRPSRVEARDYDTKPVRTRVHVELLPLELAAARQRGGRGLRSADVDTGADGTGIAQLAMPAAGRHLPRCASPRARPKAATWRQFTYLWVSGAGESDFGEGNRKTVQIIPDKKTYRAGDTAKVLIVTGKPNTPVLVSIEGRDLRSHRVMRSPDSTAHSMCRSPRRTSPASRSRPQYRAQRRDVPGHEVHQGAARRATS